MNPLRDTSAQLVWDAVPAADSYDVDVEESDAGGDLAQHPQAAPTDQAPTDSREGS